MLKWFCGLGMLVLVSCAGPRPTLDVKWFRLRDAGPNVGDGNEMVRAEELKRFYGAVTMEEREQRLGDYYTVSWSGPAGQEAQSVRVVFEYRQAATGAKVLKMEEERPGTARGQVEFTVTGETFQEGGRVLAWRIWLYRGGELVDTERSYLWN